MKTILAKTPLAKSLLAKSLLAVLLALSFLTLPNLASLSLAVEPDEVLADPALEARARDLSTGLRCLVCQNQSIDDSNAGLAKDLRVLLRERLVAGDSDEQAVGYIVGKYGDYVLLKPRFGFHTLFLWLGPFVLLAIGMIALYRMRKPAGPALAEKGLSSEEKKSLQDLLPK